MNKLLPCYQLLICSILLSAFIMQTHAGELTVDVIDAAGVPIENAAVYVEPEGSNLFKALDLYYS